MILFWDLAANASTFKFTTQCRRKSEKCDSNITRNDNHIGNNNILM